MKNKTLIIFFISFFNASIGQNRQPNYSFYNLKYNPKIITEYTYYFNKKNKVYHDSCIYTFNNKGNMVNISNYNIVDSITFITDFIYDDENLLINKIHKTKNYSVFNISSHIDTVKFKYDSKKRINYEKITVDLSLNTIRKREFYYAYDLPKNYPWKSRSDFGYTQVFCDSSNNIIGRQYFSGICSNNITYNYYLNGTLKEVVENAECDNEFSNKRYSYSINYLYDSFNNILEEKIVYQDNTGVIDKYNYEYDKYGNWIKKIDIYIKVDDFKKRIKNNKQSKTYYSRKIIYYEK
jgi:hypothetical protein